MWVVDGCGCGGGGGGGMMLCPGGCITVPAGTVDTRLPGSRKHGF
jgi:hypothetical protein